MRINRNSWHYRVQNGSYHYADKVTAEPTTLCAYCRRTAISIACTVFGVMLVSILAAIAVIVGAFFGYTPKQWDVFKFVDDSNWKYRGMWIWIGPFQPSLAHFVGIAVVIYAVTDLGRMAWLAVTMQKMVVIFGGCMFLIFAVWAYVSIVRKFFKMTCIPVELEGKLASHK